MKLPSKYEFLDEVGTLPKLVTAGLGYLGIKELPTTKDNNPVIMAMAKALGLQNIYTNDEIAWCALFISYLCVLVGKPMPFKEWNMLRASNYQTWGEPVDFKDIRLGDILVFHRPGGFHVAIAIAQSENTYHVLGGNQSNSVNFCEVEKHRLVAARRYYRTGIPESAKKYYINSSNIVSIDEA